MKNIESPFSDFKEAADTIKKFKSSSDLFTIMLKDGSIIHYTAKNPKAFKDWLLENDIEDIREDKK